LVSLRATRTIFAPNRAISLAVACPIPWVLPPTMAVLPVNEMSIFIFLQRKEYHCKASLSF
jgi:hypothetical protein